MAHVIARDDGFGTFVAFQKEEVGLMVLQGEVCVRPGAYIESLCAEPFGVFALRDPIEMGLDGEWSFWCFFLEPWRRVRDEVAGHQTWVVIKIVVRLIEWARRLFGVSRVCSPELMLGEECGVG